MKKLKKIINLVIIFIFIILIWKVGFLPRAAENFLNKVEYHVDDIWSDISKKPLNFEEIQAKYILVYKKSEDRVIYEKNRYEKIHPASTAKFYFMDYALNILDPKEDINVGDEIDLMKYGSSQAYLNKGSRYTVDNLIEAIMLPSGNDAALALAAAGGRKISDNPYLSSKEAIKIFMNNLAMYLDSNGYKDTSLTEADGYSYEDYSSLDDMLRISLKILDRDIIDEYARLVDDNVEMLDGGVRYWKNTNEMIDPENNFYNPNVSGAKTGSLKDYYNFICRYELNGEEYLILIYGSPTEEQRYIDTEIILNAIEEGEFY